MHTGTSSVSRTIVPPPPPPHALELQRVGSRLIFAPITVPLYDMIGNDMRLESPALPIDYGSVTKIIRL